MKVFIFRDTDRDEIMINIEQISSIRIDTDNMVHVITINGGFYTYSLPEHYNNNRDVYIKKFYNAIRRAYTRNTEVFAITEEDVDNETITTI